MDSLPPLGRIDRGCRRWVHVKAPRSFPQARLLGYFTAHSGRPPSALSHSEDSQRREDVRYWVMAWGRGPWHSKSAWF